MSRPGSFNIPLFFGVAAVVAAGSIGVGYMLGPRGSVAPPAPPAPVVNNTSPQQAAPTTPVPTTLGKMRMSSSDYTAPGAPNIRIIEEKTPVLTIVHPAAPKPAATDADADGSVSIGTPAATSPDTSTADGADTASSTSASTDTNSGTAPPAAQTTQPGPAPASNDPDYEKVNGATDSEAGQQGGGTDDSKSANDGPAKFRVQVGEFQRAESANVLSEALRQRGYDSVTSTQQSGDKTVYRVQVGAYRTKSAAAGTAQELQKSGYPAFVAPVGP